MDTELSVVSDVSMDSNGHLIVTTKTLLFRDGKLDGIEPAEVSKINRPESEVSKAARKGFNS